MDACYTLHFFYYFFFSKIVFEKEYLTLDIHKYTDALASAQLRAHERQGGGGVGGGKEGGGERERERERERVRESY